MPPGAIEVLIVFSFILAFVGMILAQVRWSANHKLKRQQSEQPSLAQSELKTLIREAVEDATLPLAERIEQLEAAVRTPALPPGLLDEPEDEAAEPARPRRRVT